jgi:acetyl esterase/lipase
MLCNSAEFSPRGVREKLTALLLRSIVRIAAKPALSPRIPIPWQRWWLHRLTQLVRPSHRVDIQSGICGGVRGEWVRATGAAANAGRSATILYLHGGGYCIGSPATHRPVTSRLALATMLPVFVADYRLAPEHPFPAAVDDAVAAYRSLLDAGPVVIAGDSAGGGLALATALVARQSQLVLPAALILFSPWIDLTLTALGDKARHDVVLSRAWFAACARHYLAGSDPKAPLASPIYGDPRGLPPTLIQLGSDELLHSDALRIHDALEGAGVTVRCEIVSGLWHGFHLHAKILPAAKAAIDRAGRFISDRVARLAADLAN